MHNTCMGATAPGLAAPDAAANLHSHEPASLASAAGATAGLSRSDDAHDTPHVAGTKDQQAHSDFATDDATRKEFETWRAKLAFRDYSLSRTDAADGAVLYYAGRFGLIQELADLDAVAAFARKAGAA